MGKQFGNYDLRNQKSATEWFTSTLLRLAGILIISLFDERVLERILYMPRRCTVFNNRIQIVRTLLPETISYMNSNAIPAQPKNPNEVQPQFNEACRHFGISLEASGTEKMKVSRSIGAETLVTGIMHSSSYRWYLHPTRHNRVPLIRHICA
jgi:hypothetical protein